MSVAQVFTTGIPRFSDNSSQSIFIPFFSGRYDDLLSEFDAPMGAAGFAIDTDAITMKHLSDDDVNYSDNPDVLVFAENGHEMKALRYVDELNEKGINAQFSVLETLEETEQFAKSRGIAKVESI